MANDFGYPDPRLSRTGPVSTSLAGAAVTLAPPESITIEFRIAVGVGQRSTRSYGPFVGPGLVRHVQIEVQPSANNFAAACDIGYAPSVITESLVSVLVPRTWTSFFRRGPVVGTDLDPDIIGKFLSGNITQGIQYQHDIGGIVPLTSWHLVVSVIGGGGAAFESSGYVTLLAGVSPQALANFL